MLRTCTAVLVGVALVGWSLSARAQEEECRALILKAMKAHGGKEALTKYQGAQVKYKGTVDVMGFKGDVAGEVFINYPDRMKNVIGFEINNMKIEIQQGYDGKVLWLSIMGMNQEIKDKEALAEMKESMYAEQVAGLAGLDAKEYKLAPLGDMKIRDKAAIGIRVSKEGKRDVSLWFDKTSHLLLKSEHRGKDPFGQAAEMNQEKYFIDYKAIMGLQTPQRMEVHNDGKKVVELEVTDVRYHERLDDTHFMKPLQ